MKPNNIVLQRNHQKRIIGWILIYLLIIFVFIFVIYYQARKVNTLGFVQGQITLNSSKAIYTVGDQISYTITNGLSSTISLVNNCPKPLLYVYQWESNQWVSITSQANSKSCSSNSKLIPITSGSSYHGNFANAPQLFSKPGIFRLVAFANNYQSLPYVDFEVVAKPTVAPGPKIIYQPTPVYIYQTVPAPSTYTGGDSSSGTYTGGDN